MRGSLAGVVLVLLTGLFGGLAIHYLNGRPNGISRISLQIAGGGGALGILAGTLAASGQRSLPYAQDIALGCEIGIAAGMVVDSLVLGWNRGSDRWHCWLFLSYG